MKINSYIRKSISRQFMALICFFILLFIIGGLVLVYWQNSVNNEYVSNREELVEKQALVRQLETRLNDAMFNVRGYFAYNNTALKESAESQQAEIEKLIEQFDQRLETEEDTLFSTELASFYRFYFDETMPEAIAYFESGDREEVAAIANNGATERVNSFQGEMADYLQSVSNSLSGEVSKLTTHIAILQVGFLIYIILVLIAVLLIGRVMVKRIGKPLTDFAVAANEVAKGNEAEIKHDKKRQDELATLSVAFERMYVSIQEKEQDLLAQNEELVAQQDELQAQQFELEKMLETVQSNEDALLRRNKLINGLSSSLDKQKVLESIIINMCDVIKADRGIIVEADSGDFAAFGISNEGAEQFKNHLHTGMYHRLEKEKLSFTIIRDLDVSEKGYHLEKGRVHDLYIPILSAAGSITAIMMLSRFACGFTELEMDEFSTLAKQIEISLDKIHLFEQTEKDRLLNTDILNNVQEGIQLISPNGDIIHANSKFYEIMTGKGMLDIFVGQKWQEWTGQLKEKLEETDDLIAYISKSMRDSSAESFTYKLKEDKIVKVYSEHLYRGDEKFGTVLVYRDITMEYEVDKMKSEFVSTVSHELRTPLASILGFTELIINRDLKPERQKKYLNTIYGEAKRLTALINDFLDVQRMEAGKQTYEKKYIEVLPIMERVVENQAVNATKHHITIHNTEKNSFILGDRSKIEQAFTNIVSNAIKYSPEGGTIDISLYQEDGMLKVAVKDQGLGIPESARDKLFTKFYRIDNSDRRKIGGTGLGLAIVKEIMLAHQGDITIDSEYGKGSTFTMSFPIVEWNMETSEKDAVADEKVRYKVMVVEDDYSLAELIIQELQESGFQVYYSKNGMDGIKKMEEVQPDALVLDIMLEDSRMDGWDIMKAMKDSEYLKNIPIVVSTALDEKEKGIALGAIDYLVKPYPPSQLSRAIMQTLLKMGKIGQVLIPEEQ